MLDKTVKWWEYRDAGKTAADALDDLFERNRDRRTGELKPLFIWQEQHQTSTPTLCGSYKNLSKQDLEDRVYSVHFHNDSVGIMWHDVVLVDRMENRTGDEWGFHNFRCQLIPLPSNRVFA